jgi:alpha-2-macroglobulin
VRRSYSAIDDPRDVVKTKDGYKIRLGSRVMVTVEAVNTTKRYAVALVDPRPAGLEAVDEHLAVSERAADTGAISRWDFRDERDDRSEAFAMELAEGSHRFAYTARATTPGTFIAAPAKAEEMYSPETFGRSTGAVVVVE